MQNFCLLKAFSLDFKCLQTKNNDYSFPYFDIKGRVKIYLNEEVYLWSKNYISTMEVTFVYANQL